MTSARTMTKRAARAAARAGAGSPARGAGPGPARRPARGRARGRARAAIAGGCLVATALLSACGDAAVDDGGARSGAAWTRAELEEALDLSELGELSRAADGTWTAGGRPLPAEALEGLDLPLGRERNVLGLSDEAYEALDPAAASALWEATPDEARALLADYGLSVSDIRAWTGKSDGYGVADLRLVAARLDERAEALGAASGTTSGAASGAASPGERLLADLGLEPAEGSAGPAGPATDPEAGPAPEPEVGGRP